MYEVWQAPEVIVAFGTLLAGTAAVAGAFIAGIGLSTWKVQANWHAERDLAKEILTLIYLHRDAIAVVRHPAIWAAETAEAVKDRGELGDIDRDTRRFEENAAVYEKRWQKITDVRSDLYPKLLEAEVMWEIGAKEIMKPLFDLETELRIAIQNYLRASNPTLQDAYREAASERFESKRDIMYDEMTDDDEFRSDYNAALVPIEDFLREKFGRK